MDIRLYPPMEYDPGKGVVEKSCPVAADTALWYFSVACCSERGQPRDFASAGESLTARMPVGSELLHANPLYKLEGLAQESF